MNTVRCYDEFLGALNEVGFMLLFSGKSAMQGLDKYTPPENWFSDDPTRENPWDWKDRLSANRDGVYTRAIDRRNTLISWKWFPKFLAAFLPSESLQTRYEYGFVPEMNYRMWKLFQEHDKLGKHEISMHLGITRKERGRFDKALVDLQAEMYLVVSGQSQRLGKNGAPIGWPSMEFARTDAWVDATLLDEADTISPRQAKRDIADRIVRECPDISDEDIHRLMRMSE